MTQVLLLLGSVSTQALGLAAIRASHGLRRPGWAAAAFVGMTTSVMLMSQALARGMSLAMGYGIWSGAGIVLATAAGVLVFGDRLTRIHLFGLALVSTGVAVVYAGG